MTTRKLDTDKLKYIIDRHFNLPKRYNLDKMSGMEESYNGVWVKWEDYKAREAVLVEEIRKLTAEVAVAHNKGYSEGQYAGPDYNMRNN